jgi:hypothetical protein
MMIPAARVGNQAGDGPPEAGPYENEIRRRTIGIFSSRAAGFFIAQMAT